MSTPCTDSDAFSEQDPGARDSDPRDSVGARREHRFAVSDDLVATLSTRIGEALRRAVAERGHATLVVSGGSTPRPLFKALSAMELPWHSVRITLADERWVDVEHPDSNERMVRRHLLRGPASRAEWVSLVSGHETPDAALETIAQRLDALPRPFDVVLLGMGLDGHTASLFPGAAALAKGLDPTTPSPCIAVHPPAAPHPRMSLTAQALADSRWRVLHLRGDAKWRVYRQAVAPGPVNDLPIRGLIRTGLDVYWSP